MTPLSLGTVDLTAFIAPLFTAQPEAPAFVLAGASGWAVNGSPQDATKSTVCKAEEVDLEQSN